MRKGSGFGPRGTGLPLIVDRYTEGKINIDNPISCTPPLDKISNAFELTREGKSVRSVVGA
jgi:S-(hydroxymethyl)glutathione dehydrogenase / alcohol dehydrogenase